MHVDQDALEFITRFFEFKDETAPASTPAGDQPFIQRLEVMAVHMKLDYKPKRVDYRSIRSGHTTEFKIQFKGNLLKLIAIIPAINLHSCNHTYHIHLV